jgi:hypothetical protein
MLDLFLIKTTKDRLVDVRKRCGADLHKKFHPDGGQFYAYLSDTLP